MVCAPGKPAASPRKAAPKRKGVKS
jgi:hypothetical protein